MRRRVVSIMFLVSLVFLLFVSGVAAQITPTLNSQTVDVKGFSGENSIIKVDSTNKPHIAYSAYPVPLRDRGDTDIMYASLTGSKWNTEKVAAGGTVMDFVLDSHDQPHIIFRNGSILKYAYWANGYWNIQTVAYGVNYYASLSLDTSDNPHIAYDWGNLKYASFNGSSWNIQTVPETDNCSRAALALDKNDNPHIAFEQNTSPTLYSETSVIRYAVWSPTADWNIQDTPAQNSHLSNLALDSEGFPHFTCTGTTVLYASWNGSAWQTQTIAAYNDGGYFALDRYNQPNVVYFNREQGSFNGDLMYARLEGYQWIIQKLANNTASGPGTIAIDSNQIVHISYAGFLLGQSTIQPVNITYMTTTEPLTAPPFPTPAPTTVYEEGFPVWSAILVVGIVSVVLLAFVYLLRTKSSRNKR